MGRGVRCLCGHRVDEHDELRAVRGRGAGHLCRYCTGCDPHGFTPGPGGRLRSWLARRELRRRQLRLVKLKARLDQMRAEGKIPRGVRRRLDREAGRHRSPDKRGRRAGS